MNVWTIIAVIAAMIFGGCVGYIIAQLRAKCYIDNLLKTCEETNNKLTKLSEEYEDFVKSAQELDRWPRHNPHVVMKENLTDYLKSKYFGTEEAENHDGAVCEDEIDLYI